MSNERTSSKRKPQSANAVTFEDNIGVRIVRIAEVFSRLAKIGVEQPWGLRSTELRILNILDGVDSVSIVDIARRTHVDKGWISRSARDLEARGLIARKGDETDFRKTHAFLTEEGRRLLDEIRPFVVWHEQRVLKGIDEAELKRSLDRLLSNAEDILETAEGLGKWRKPAD